MGAGPWSGRLLYGWPPPLPASLQTSATRLYLHTHLQILAMRGEPIPVRAIQGVSRYCLLTACCELPSVRAEERWESAHANKSVRRTDSMSRDSMSGSSDAARCTMAIGPAS